MRTRTSFSRARFWPVYLFLVGMALLRPGFAAESFVLDLSAATASPPSWLEVIPADPAASDTTFASADYGIKPPAESKDLAVTFFFTETEGGSLRVYWQGEKEAVTLCDNLYEGVAMPNQRTLLVPKEILGNGGTLTVLSSATVLNISRIEWSWVTVTTVATADPETAPSLLRIGNQSLRPDETSGEPLVPAPDRIREQVITAVIQQAPVRIDDGVLFVATLEALPFQARIEVRLAGVPLDRNVTVWVNDLPVNQLSLEVPDLSDPGYVYPMATPPVSAPVYFGWRKGVVYVPVSALREGENRFRFALMDSGVSGTASPLGLKEFNLQLSYEAPPAAAQAELIGPISPDQP